MAALTINIMTVEQITKDYLKDKNIDVNMFNFRGVDLSDWNASKSVWKEATGYCMLQKVGFDFVWNNDKLLQKQGVDFVYKNKNHDLKALVGNYHTDGDLYVTIELKQYGKKTLVPKATDVMIFTVLEENSKSIVLIDYKTLLKMDFTNYEKRTSCNGTGEYVRIAVKDIPGAKEIRVQ